MNNRTQNTQPTIRFPHPTSTRNVSMNQDTTHYEKPQESFIRNTLHTRSIALHVRIGTTFGTLEARLVT